jgi:FlaA1/EpsC-like NDP-sugar epimerase
VFQNPERFKFVSSAYRVCVHTLRRARIVSLALNALLFAIAAAGAFFLRFDFHIPPVNRPHLLMGIAIWVVVKSLIFSGGRMGHNNWRHASGPDILAIVGYNLCGSLAAIPFIYLAGPFAFPRSIYLLDLILSTQLGLTVYIFARLLRESHELREGKNSDRVLIYGAGSGGATLFREIRKNPALGYQVCGFLDDDPYKQDTTIQRTPVVGTGADLPDLAPRYDISQVLIAIPSRNSDEMTRMVQHCRDAQVPCKTVPGIAELIGANGLTSQIREVAMEDLLDRKPVRLSEEDIRTKILGHTVMVTGAAGSIGSELCRQLARFHPRAIVGFDSSETALFHIQQEMSQSFPEVPFIAEIGNIQNRNRIQHALEEHAPSMLYHAAAYKHVPMMEANIFEAVENNVLGTHTVALAAAEAGVRDFVLISSDKAVNPTNIMGATKRAAELIIRGMEGYDTKYVSVRFGNVLGSNGSVVPTFKRQIAAGGPVTVTHPEMRRYFMTIPEAAQLVIQASTMGHGGELFVLDMGDQVKIVDLARRLILLSGFRPDKDIPIAFTGMRPGEKLYEELNLDEETTLSTYHPKIKIFRGSPPPLDLASQLRTVRALCQSRDERGLLSALCRIAPDYTPGVHLTTSRIKPNRRGVRIVASA